MSFWGFIFSLLCLVIVRQSTGRAHGAVVGIGISPLRYTGVAEVQGDTEPSLQTAIMHSAWPHPPVLIFFYVYLVMK